MVVNTALVYILLVAGILLLAIVRSILIKKSRLRGFFKLLGALEVTVITLLLGSLVFFGCLQIVLRNFFHSGIVWADPLMRHIVLWLGCLGGVMATSRLRHINIDIFTRVLPAALKPLRNRIVYLATAAAASVLGMATLKLVIDEKDFGDTAFLGIQVWVLQIILPVAFFLITYRSLVNMIITPAVKPVEWEDFESPGSGDAPPEPNPES